MKYTIIAAIITGLLLVAGLSWGATATLNRVDTTDTANGIVMYMTIVDDGGAGTFDMALFVSNATILAYSTWLPFQSNVLIPAIQAEITARRTIANRTSFLISKVGQSITVP